MPSVSSPPLTPAIRRTTKPAQALPSMTLKSTTGAGTSFDLGGAFSTFGVMLFRGTTGSSGGSTKASVRLQGSLDGTHWFTVGAATLAVSSTAGAMAARASTVGPVTFVRLSINTFTTSAGANPDKNRITGLISVQGV